MAEIDLMPQEMNAQVRNVGKYVFGGSVINNYDLREPSILEFQYDPPKMFIVVEYGDDDIGVRNIHGNWV